MNSLKNIAALPSYVVFAKTGGLAAVAYDKESITWSLPGKNNYIKMYKIKTDDSSTSTDYVQRFCFLQY